MKLFRRILPLMVLGLGIAVAYYIFSTKAPVKRKPARALELTVETQVLEPQSFGVRIDTQGVVEPRTTTTLIPRISGEIINVSSHFRPGGFFEKGDTLLTIDQSDYKLDIKTAQADLAEAQFNFAQEQAQAQLATDNWERLGRQQAASDLALHKPQLARAKAAVDSAGAKLQKIELDLQRTQIKAPYAGRILEQFVDVGQYVSPGNPLVKIFATDYVEIRLPITEKQRGMLDLPRAYSGEPIDTKSAAEATITAAMGGKDYSWSGRVIRTEGSVDKSTRQVYLIAQVDYPYKRMQDDRPPLEIGQFVKAEIQGKKLEAVYVLPRTAIQGNDTILLVDQDDRLQRKKIDILWETRDQLVVRNGLIPGERLCVTYVPFAANGAKVKSIDTGN